jgi:hypothetical protein
MKATFADAAEVILLEHRDVPEPSETDPFEDAITEEIVRLDVRRLEVVDVELL